MKDQYGNDVPNDLVLLPSPSDLSDWGICIIDWAKWYEADGVLMASAKEIYFLSEAEPADADIDLDNAEILYVADSLHRYSLEDGFYHA